jgi:uncharacterized membrane protein
MIMRIIPIIKNPFFVSIFYTLSSIINILITIRLSSLILNKMKKYLFFFFYISLLLNNSLTLLICTLLLVLQKKNKPKSLYQKSFDFLKALFCLMNVRMIEKTLIYILLFKL